MTGSDHNIHLARPYDDAGNFHGARLLVDHIWPRGISKDDLALDAWVKEVAPSDDLRRWFDHDPDRWAEFRNRYMSELKDNRDAVDECLDWVRKGTVTLLFAARDRDHNNAVVLRDYLELVLRNSKSS